MIVTYAPDNGEKKTFDYKPDDLLSAEAEAIEDATGQTFDEVNIGLLKGSVRARRAVLWVLLKREDPALRFKDVQFRQGEVTVEWSTAEKRDIRKALRADKSLDDDTRETAIRALGFADDDEEPPEPAAPKAPSSPRSKGAVQGARPRPRTSD